MVSPVLNSYHVPVTRWRIKHILIAGILVAIELVLGIRDHRRSGGHHRRGCASQWEAILCGAASGGWAVPLRFGSDIHMARLQPEPGQTSSDSCYRRM